MELDLLKLVSTATDYERYSPFIKTDRLSDTIVELYESLGEFYEETSALTVDWNNWFTWYTTLKHPSLDSVKVGILQQYSKELASMTAVDSTVLKAFLARDYAAQLTDMGQQIVDGTGKYNMTDVTDLVASHEAESRTTNQFLDGERVSIDDIEEQLADLEDSQKFNWRLNELQISLGPIKKGDFIIIGARPDSGKTTFLASEVTYFAKQLKDDQCVLWLNNEEMLSRVKDRQVQAALGWTHQETKKDLARTKEEWIKALGGEGRLVTYDDNNMSITDVDRAVAQYKPSLVVIDQLWKLKGYEKESVNEIDRFSKVAAHLRTLAKDVGPVLVTSQLDGSADSMAYPDMNSLYNSKTAVQGEADAIVLIGINLKENAPDVRFIRAPKNKLPFGNHKFRNQGWAVKIDAERARYVSVTKEPRPTVT